MKKCRFRILSGIVTAAILLAGCQPTPDTQAVRQLKESQYKETAAPGANQAVIDRAGARWEDHIDAYNGKLTVDIAADIQAEGDAWPVYRIQLMDFTQEMIDTIANEIFGDAIDQLESPGKPMTKDDVRDEIIDKKQLIELIKQNPHEYDNSIEEIEERIVKLQKELEEAPETSEYERETIQLQDGRVQVCGDAGREGKAFFWAENASVYGSFLRYSNTGMPGPDGRCCEGYDMIFSTDTYTVDIQKGKEQALQEAKDFLRACQIDGYAFEGTVLPYGYSKENGEYSQCAYGFMFTRVYNNRARRVIDPKEDTVTGGTTADADGATFRFGVKNDSLTVIVDDHGAAGMIWDSPTVQTGIEAENVPLLPFEEIRTAMGNALKTRHAYFNEDNKAEARQIRMTKVELGYVVTNAKDSYAEYRVTPAWIGYDGDIAVVGINATDGSILGYRSADPPSMFG